jgi:tetratricopeptide (TPR) repeat protein
MHQLIQVFYPNRRRGVVDDITLDELIRSQKISHLFRPSEDRWVDISVDAVRKSETPYAGREKRSRQTEEGRPEEEGKKPRGLLVRLLRRKEEPVSPKELTAEDWFQQGFIMWRNADDQHGALRAFAKAIQLDSAYHQAFLNRGTVYELVGNTQQALDDYSRAIELAPDNARLYYVRGLVLRRLGKEGEAIIDLQKAADLGYRPATDALRPRGIAIVEMGPNLYS